MKRWAWTWGSVCVVLLGVIGGCGRPTLPGQQFKGERRTVPGAAATDTPLPEKPFLEWGSQQSKVRLVAFYPIDDPHEKLIALLKEQADKYPGKVYVKYVDYRTPEGREMFVRAQTQVTCVLINGKSSVDLDSPTGPRTVDFVREMGRFWTADDLREAVSQVVRKTYSRRAAART